jgi:hypothetical protein
MSDADNQMGGHGSDTGKDPADQSATPPDPVKGNTGDDKDEGEDEQPKADKEST